ncbi:hypothetical protein PFICI_00652 [Pestalotiopsis fici W106-1]|uniref:Uncharacterized protein n=1 Tax=Pestalotiopsis fici (strain W106-1 / CGMCC3.15140) TaxID=1229662 RepID=W3XLE4_PESFW|nr:uncharacterized protein PFICI_00652 [Pestalotiopsis fici W106-1]ETS86824.1 hypothetical protein PFICI_00652 [Pestalotiopsis fici W106-1]
MSPAEQKTGIGHCAESRRLITHGDCLLVQEDAGASTRAYIESSGKYLASLVGQALNNRSVQERKDYISNHRVMTQFELHIVRGAVAELRRSILAQYKVSGPTAASCSAINSLKEDLERCKALGTMEANLMAKLQWVDSVECRVYNSDCQHSSSSSCHDNGGNGPTTTTTLSQRQNIPVSRRDLDRDGGLNNPSVLLPLSLQSVNRRDGNQPKLRDPSMGAANNTDVNNVSSVVDSLYETGFRVDQCDDEAILAQWQQAFVENPTQSRFPEFLQSVPRAVPSRQLTHHVNKVFHGSATVFESTPISRASTQDAIRGIPTLGSLSGVPELRENAAIKEGVLVDVSESPAELYTPECTPKHTGCSTDDKDPLLIDLTDSQEVLRPSDELAIRQTDSLDVLFDLVTLIPRNGELDNSGCANGTSRNLIDLDGNSTFVSGSQTISQRTSGNADNEKDTPNSCYLTPISKFAWHPQTHCQDTSEDENFSHSGQLLSVTNIQETPQHGFALAHHALQEKSNLVASPLRPQHLTVGNVLGENLGVGGQSKTNGLQYVTAAARARNNSIKSGSESSPLGCQAVILSGLPCQAKLQDVMPRVRGGKIVQATMADTSALQVGRSAYVVFANSTDASAYVDFAKENPGYVTVLGQQVYVHLAGTLTYPRHGMRQPWGDETRHVSLGGRVSRDLCSRLFRQIESMFRHAEDALEDVWYDATGSCLMLFKNIDYAIRFHSFVRNYPSYKHVAEEIYFVDDPCSGPLADLASPACFARGANQSLLHDWLKYKYGIVELSEQGTDQLDVTPHEPAQQEDTLSPHRPQGILIDLSDEDTLPAAVQVSAPSSNLETLSSNLGSDAADYQAPHCSVMGSEPLDREPLPSKTQDATLRESKPAVCRIFTMEEFLKEYAYEEHLRDPVQWRKDFLYLGHMKKHTPE